MRYLLYWLLLLCPVLAMAQTSPQNSFNVRIPCNFPGSDAFVQIQNAANDIPVPGGTVDARCYGNTAQVIGASSTLTLGVTGTAGKRIILLLDPSTSFTLNNNNSSTCVIALTQGSGMIAEGPAWFVNAFVFGGFQLANTASVQSVICVADQSGPQQNFFLRGIAVKTNGSGAAISRALIDVEGVGDSSSIENCSFSNFNGVGLLLKSNTGITGPVNLLIKNVWLNGGGLTNAVPLQIRGTSGNVANITIVGGTITNAGPTQFLVDADCLTFTTCFNLNFTGTYFETTQAAMVTAINLKDMQHVGFNNVQLGGLTVTNAVTLAQSGAGKTHDISFNNFLNSVGTNFLNDTINTQTVTGVDIDGYFGTTWVDRSLMPRIAFVTGDVSNSTTTPANLTGMVWPIAPSKKYALTCQFMYQAAATGGLKVSFTGPATPTQVTYCIDAGVSLTAKSNACTQGTTFATSIGTVVTTATTNMPATMTAFVENGTTIGNLQVQFASVAAVSTTVKRDSYCWIQETK